MKSASHCFHYTEIQGKKESTKKFTQYDKEAIDFLNQAGRYKVWSSNNIFCQLGIEAVYSKNLLLDIALCTVQLN
jgi:hypothetical protein